MHGIRTDNPTTGLPDAPATGRARPWADDPDEFPPAFDEFAAARDRFLAAVRPPARGARAEARIAALGADID